jgi:hypothetical protein
MMLRIIFTGLATCVLLLAAGVRFAREDAPPVVRKALGSALEQAIESAKEALPRPAAQTSPEPAPEAAVPLPLTAEDTAPPSASKPMPPPAQVAARTPAREVESVTEESISPLWSAPFVESPEAAPGDPGRQAPRVAAAPSQDEWAGLIRRMLAIYERVGAAE